MKPRRTHNSTDVLRLPGGTEDNDLWITAVLDTDSDLTLQSVWEPTPEERQAIADGDNVLLIVWANGHPPVAVGVADQGDWPLGKKPDPPMEEEPRGGA